MPCPACGQPAEVVCRRCRVPTELPPDADHFFVLGLAPRLDLDPADLGDRMVARTQQVHPDRFQARPTAERERALAWASAINNAYRTLRDDAARAQYWLERRGLALREQTDSVAPALAAQLFEAREALAAVQAAPDDAAARAALADARTGIDEALTAGRRGLRAIFHQHDAAATPSEAAIHLSDLRRALAVVRALAKCATDLAAGIEP